MGKVAVRRPRGTRDFGPGEMFARRQVEAILRKNAVNYGYREIATPTFEHLELFTRKSGEEIVDQLYTFQDKGGRTLSLRPELTAAVLRFYAEDMAYLPKPVKVYYFGNCFRYERPQKGRYREFWQFGAECIGSSTTEAASEIIALAHQGMMATGLRNCVLRIGHLGILKGILEKLGVNEKQVMTLIDKGNLEGISEYFSEKGYNNVELLIDILGLKGNPEALEKGWKMLSSVIDERSDDCDGSKPEWKEMIEEGFKALMRISRTLSTSGIAHVIDYGIARGLDYYTGMVFEIDVPSLGAEKQICGGGEYNLSELFSMNIKGTSGFAIGFDRLLMALETEGVTFGLPDPLVGVVPIPGSEETAFSLTSDLRRSGIATELELSGRGLKKALSRMNNLGVRFTVITGESELERGNIVLRDMSTGEQEEISIDEVKKRIIQTG